MNHAKSPLPGTPSLLLLVPLLLAGSPPALTAAREGVLTQVSAPTALELSGVPTAPRAGVPFFVMVVARDGAGAIAETYAGTIEFSSTDPSALLPRSYTFDPTADKGQKGFQVTLQTPGTWELRVQDIASSSLTGRIPGISVLSGVATRFEIEGLPSETFPHKPLSFKVKPVDSAGNPGSFTGVLHFESDDPLAQLPPDGPLAQSYTVTFRSSNDRPWFLRVMDTNGTAGGSTAILVKPAPAQRVMITTSLTNPRPTCSDVTIKLAVVDAGGNPVPESATVELCRPIERNASPVERSFGTVTAQGECVTGTFTSEAEVTWRNAEAEDVPFSVYGVEPVAPVTVSWRPMLDISKSSFSFVSTSEETPKLATGIGQRIVKLSLKDSCSRPLALPPDKTLTFSATPPLVITTTPKPDVPSEWLVTLELPECPADPSQPLAVWPQINGMDILKTGSAERVERQVLPRCVPKVELAVGSLDKQGMAEPGGQVEFEVEISNLGQEPVLNGVLKLSSEGLTVLEARKDGTALTPKGEGFVIPELLPNTKVKVKITAQATTELDQKATASVWFVSPEGLELTLPQEVSFTVGNLGVNVGCGCHAASLPGQLWPWLALLLAASRPWDRSRRLRRSERTDR